MLGGRIVSHRYAKFHFADMIEGQAVRIRSSLTFVFVLRNDTTSAEGEGGAGWFWATDNLIGGGRGTLTADTVVHGSRDALVKRERVLGREVIT